MLSVVKVVVSGLDSMMSVVYVSSDVGFVILVVSVGNVIMLVLSIVLI